jgi:hypothetical protein
MNYGSKYDSDVQDPEYADFYGPAQPEGTQPDEAYLKDWEARTLELIDRYRPQVLYFDWWIEQPAFEPYRRRVAAYYYDRAAAWGKGVVLNYKNDAYPRGAAVYDVERGTLPGIRALPWQTCTSVGWRSWGYVENESYKNPVVLIRDFIDIVSKNGCLLLNVGPKPDGTIPQEAQDILLKMGEWLKVNGEAVYGTRPWVAYGEGPNRAKGGGFSEGKVTYGEGDVRFTRKGNTLYIIPLLCPTKPLTITLLGEKLAPRVMVKGVTLLGSTEKVGWERNADGLLLPPPAKPVKQAVVYKALLEGSLLGGLGIEADGYDLTAEAVLQNYGVKPVTEEVTLEASEKLLATASVMAAAQESVTFELKGRVAEGGVARVSLTEKGKEFFGKNLSLPNVRLDGEWLFAKGDKGGWSKMDFDDSSWQKVKLPDKWENHSGYIEDNVYGWYRKHVMIPADWKGKTLVLPLGKIDDCDETFFNGKEVGHTGQMPPEYESAYDKERRYEVPPKLVKWGGENVIAVRVYDTSGGGGIVEGPLGPVEIKRF